jgi:hypothetical protein
MQAGNLKRRESIFDPELFFPKALNISLYGRSSDLSRFSEAFPFPKVEQWQVFSKTIITQSVIGHHSSGYCYGFSPYSLFIAMVEFHCNTKTLQRYMFLPIRKVLQHFRYKQLLTLQFMFQSDADV